MEAAGPYGPAGRGRRRSFGAREVEAAQQAAAGLQSEPSTNVVVFDGSLLDAGPSVGGDGRSPLRGGLGSLLAAERSFEFAHHTVTGGPAPSSNTRPSGLPSTVRFTKPLPANAAHKDHAFPGALAGQAPRGAKTTFLLTPPTVSGVSCAPRLDLGSGPRGFAEASLYRKTLDSYDYDDEVVTMMRPAPAKGLTSTMAKYAAESAPRSPFKSTIEGLSVSKLASLNTKFSEDFILSQSEQPIKPLPAISSAASSEYEDKRDFITVLGRSTGLPTSPGPWWSNATLGDLPTERGVYSQGKDSSSEFGWEPSMGSQIFTDTESLASPVAGIKRISSSSDNGPILVPASAECH